MVLKFSTPVKIHTDGGKEVVNKLSNELFTLLNVQHTKTTPDHPQCNMQVEVFSTKEARYFLTVLLDTMLDWENFLPALMLSYNTSYHSTIATTPFKLFFGEKPRLLSFPNPDIQRLHYRGSTSAEQYQLLQKKFDSWLRTFQKIMVLILKTILIKMHFHTAFKLTILCGTKILHLWGKTLN
jgi:hypothetical protein